MNNQAIISLATHPPIDWVIVFVIFIILLIDNMRSGTGRSAAIALAAPASLFLFEAVTHAAFLASIVATLKTPVLHAALLGGIFVVLVMLFHRIMYSFGKISASFLQSVIAALSATAVLLVMWLQVPLLATIWHFGSQFQNVFGVAYAFWWMLGAYIALAFVRS